MKTEFKVGDKVAAYWDDGDDTSPSIRTAGNIISIDGCRLKIKVIHDGANDAYFVPGGIATFHIKQCRKLIKKKRREIWVYWPSIETGSLTQMFTKEPVGLDGYTRFIEANKK